MGLSQTTELRHTRLFPTAVLMACALGGCLCAVAVWFDPFLVVAGLAGSIVLAMLVVFLGVTGCLVLTPVITAFLFMNRFEETWAISLGNSVSITPVFICMALCTGILGVHVLFHRHAPPAAPYLTSFSRWYILLLGLFAGVGFFSVFINHWTDVYVRTRYLPGELLSLLIISLPALFVLSIPASTLSQRRTLWGLRIFIGLGAFAGFIMTLFGLMPEQVMGMLGWVHATGGTLELVRGRLPLGHPNRVAATMLMILPVTVMLGLGDKRTSWRAIYLISAMFMFCGILFSLSRSALLNTMILLGLTLVHYFFGRKEKRMMGIVLVCLLSITLAIAAGYLFAHYDFSRFWSRGYHEDTSVERRSDSLRTALYVLADHPIWGVGPDSVYPRVSVRPGWTPIVQDSISPIIYYRGHPTAETPHNFYLHVLAEFGIAGGAFFLGMVFMIAWVFWRARRTPGLTLEERETITGLLYGVFAVLMAGCFEAVLMAGLRPNIVIWVFWGVGLRYVFLVVEEARGRISMEAPV
ncbi:MAG TPA: O-antigen ligase family protein [Candidatus Hydrogenedentes bacterium]|nr:O-antigen ligase family protein [Candidatus Hydrogenedentota bacterium]